MGVERTDGPILDAQKIFGPLREPQQLGNRQCHIDFGVDEGIRFLHLAAPRVI